MVAIKLDSEKYIVSYSTTSRTPGSIVVNAIPEVSCLQELQCYQYIDGEFIFDSGKWTAYCAAQEEAARIEAITQEIEWLQKTLASSDQLVLECLECAAAGLEMPYDITKLHEERQALRDQINELQLTL